ncbi:MAG: BLUF domain-containing protein [Verrucomicrobiota bacterium]
MSDSAVPVFQLVYVSSARIIFTPPQLSALLEHSRKKNALAGLSGILLSHDGDFMQLLEGEESTVRSTYARIAEDPRHHRCQILISGSVPERTFPDWTMGFRDLASEEVKAMPGYSGFLSREAAQVSFPTAPGRAMKLLQVFRAGLR